MAKNEKTSKRIGSLAGKQLQNPKTPAKYRPVLGSVLSQAPDKPKRSPKKK